MRIAVVKSRALTGMHAPQVTVEVHLANGLPCFTLVGLADTEVKEARERVRSAILNSGWDFPSNRRITVNLAPADLPKDSGRFDLPIALGILAASAQIPAHLLDQHEFVGELSLAGELRPIRGALAMTCAIRRQTAAPFADVPRGFVLPSANAQEAALVSGLRIFPAPDLRAVCAHLTQALALEPLAACAMKDGFDAAPEGVGDLCDVIGQAAGKRALEVAAAGQHALLMVGPPGSGKSLLASRLPGLLPPMNEEEALAAAALRSICSAGFDVQQWGRRPWRAPHHSATAAALIGGGVNLRPGEVSLAHGGVLFTDELPEFRCAALEALREPLECGLITLSRGARQAVYPARFQWLAAMNPCPCGYWGQVQGSCRCSPQQVARYQGRLSGPLVDRLDMQVDMPRLLSHELQQAHTGLNAGLNAGFSAGPNSATVRQRVALARQRQLQRQGKCNQALNESEMETHLHTHPESLHLLLRSLQTLSWSARAYHRVLRVARTIADLAQSPEIAPEHMAEAIQYRRVLQPAPFMSG